MLPGKTRFCGRPYALTCGLALIVATSAAAVHAGPQRGPWVRVEIPDVRTSWAVRSALAGAAEWLGNERCQGVFADFRDVQGRRLDEKLAEMGTTGQSYLQAILFRDGEGLEQCRDGQALAVTTPGSRVVFVCGRRFAREWAESSRAAKAAALHEALHSLGLGENPPTSRQITDHVLRRCAP